MAQEQKASPLQRQIDRLELRREETLQGIKSQLRLAGNSLKPVNIIKDAARDVIESHDVRKLLLKAAGTVAVAFILRQVIQKGEKHNDEQRENQEHEESFWDRTLQFLMRYAGAFLADQVKAFMARQDAGDKEDSMEEDQYEQKTDTA
jgi:hypothetical protein